VTVALGVSSRAHARISSFDGLVATERADGISIKCSSWSIGGCYEVGHRWPISRLSRRTPRDWRKPAAGGLPSPPPDSGSPSEPWRGGSGHWQNPGEVPRRRWGGGAVGGQAARAPAR